MAYGVRKDLLIRIFKAMMIDVWKGVYENLKAHFSEYPKKRVFKNLYYKIIYKRLTFAYVLQTNGLHRSFTHLSTDYVYADIAGGKWDNGFMHIGLFFKARSKDQKSHLMVYNIDAEQVLEDCLFNFIITGHYCYG